MAAPSTTSCSVLTASAGEPLAGTAPEAAFWLALEQPGPWGDKAFTDSHLDPSIGKALERAVSRAGGRALLIRPVGAHPAAAGPRRVYVSVPGTAGAAALVTRLLDDPADLLDVSFEAVADGEAPAGFTASEPVLLICTHGRRDVCCATSGRPLASAVAQARPGSVWECSHTNGHRFAPTAVLLPTGQLLGRLDPASALAALDEAADGRVAIDPSVNRGLSRLAPPVQVVDGLLRSRTGEARADAWTLTSTSDDDRHTVVVAETGEQFTLVRSRAGSRPVSCGRDPEPVESWVVKSSQH